MIHRIPQRGFTLLIAVILSSVALALGLALLDIAYKQVLLASSAKQSQAAFYNADTVLECALYFDQQADAFSYSAPVSSITCNSIANITVVPDNSATPRTRKFTVPCTASGGIMGDVTVTKLSDATTNIFANGYSTCDQTNQRRIERGLKISY